jgi:hypothetical protein
MGAESITPQGFWLWGVMYKKVLGDDLLSRARCTLPLAQERFTSEFGMGSGGTKPLWSPSKGEVKRVKLSELFTEVLNELRVI